MGLFSLELVWMSISCYSLQSTANSSQGQIAFTKQQYNILEHIYGFRASKPEMLSLSCVQAYQQALSGQYEAALSSLIAVDPVQYKTLRMNNLYLGFANLIRSRRALHRLGSMDSLEKGRTADWYNRIEVFASERLLRQLKPLRRIAEPDIAFETRVLEVEYLQRQGELATAFDKIQELIDKSRSSGSSGELLLPTLQTEQDHS